MTPYTFKLYPYTANPDLLKLCACIRGLGLTLHPLHPVNCKACMSGHANTNISGDGSETLS